MYIKAIFQEILSNILVSRKCVRVERRAMINGHGVRF